MRLPEYGDKDAPVLVVCDAPTEELFESGKPIGGGMLRYFSEVSKKHNFYRDDFAFISPCPPIQERDKNSDSRKKAHILEWHDQFHCQIAEYTPEVIIVLGNTAGLQTTGRPMPITKHRGVMREHSPKTYALNAPVFPMLSPGQCLRRPENKDIFDSDFRLLGQIADNGWQSPTLVSGTEVDYKWCLDLEEVLDLRPQLLAVDTETTGVSWYRPEVYPLVVQMSWEEGQGIAVPVCTSYYPDMSMRRRSKLRKQLRELMADERVHKIGHNHKFDNHILDQFGVPVRNWYMDTQDLAFVVDENMLEKSLDECVRRWVPEMAGYADAFNKDPVHKGKTRMDLVPHEDMLAYSCGDTDATLRLAKVLAPLARSDERQFNCYSRIIRPAIGAFRDVVEPHGMGVDTPELHKLVDSLAEEAREMYDELIAMVPRAVKQRHVEAKKELSFSRQDFVRDVLFSRDGFNLTPKVFTKSTQDLDKADRLPSTSAKDHLPYFVDLDFVAKLIQYQKLTKMRDTYVGEPEHYETITYTTGKRKGTSVQKHHEATGFWQYIHNDRIYPSFMLHRTNTGRCASAAPNAQNIPKRGKHAKAYRKVFVPRPGYVYIETDLSQAEIRIAAWMANERNMINIYRNDGDIHSATAAGAVGISPERFYSFEDNETPLTECMDVPGVRTFLLSLPESERPEQTLDDFFKMKRFQAKAINFGFLYGMGWRKFKTYAKTDYGIEFTDEQAQELRNNYFRTYPALQRWHEAMREEVKENHEVRALHGALRRLPSICSEDEGIQAECQRQAVNAPVQRLGSDIGLIALSRLARDADPDLIRPVSFIHDAVILECREDYAEEGAAAAKFYMETTPWQEWFGIEPPLPIKADASIGTNLGTMEERKDIQTKRPDWYRPELDVR